MPTVYIICHRFNLAVYIYTEIISTQTSYISDVLEFCQVTLKQPSSFTYNNNLYCWYVWLISMLSTFFICASHKSIINFVARCGGGGALFFILCVSIYNINAGAIWLITRVHKYFVCAYASQSIRKILSRQGLGTWEEHVRKIKIIYIFQYLFCLLH